MAALLTKHRATKPPLTLQSSASPSPLFPSMCSSPVGNEATRWALQGCSAQLGAVLDLSVSRQRPRAVDNNFLILSASARAASQSRQLIAIRNA